MFSEQIYKNRRNQLQNAAPDGVLLFLGNILNPRNFEHNEYPFRQDSSFLYYFGIQEPRLAAVIDKPEGKTIIFGDELSLDDIVWMGRLETIHHKAERAGIADTRPFSALSKYIEQAKSKGRVIHFLPPYQPSNKILLSELLATPIAHLQPSVPFLKAVIAQRSCKEEVELAEIDKAVNVTNLMHLEAMRQTREGVPEYKIVSAMQKVAGDHDCTFSYASIFTMNGQTLHNHDHSGLLKSGRLVLNDSGAETPMGYAGDLTRTFPVGAKFTNRQREIYDVVLNTHLQVAQALKPGLKYKTAHLLAARVIAEGLTALGIMKGNVDEAVAAGAHALFFPHGLGHMMGLDVHDMEDLGETYVGYTPDEPKDLKTFGLNALRLGKALQKGYVLTDEPGIYFIPELIDMWEKEKQHEAFINYKKVREYIDFGGIRIEDNFVITEKGSRKLGDYLIKTADEIEAFRS